MNQLIVYLFTHQVNIPQNFFQRMLQNVSLFWRPYRQCKQHLKRIMSYCDVSFESIRNVPNKFLNVNDFASKISAQFAQMMTNIYSMRNWRLNVRQVRYFCWIQLVMTFARNWNVNDSSPLFYDFSAREHSDSVCVDQVLYS